MNLLIISSTFPTHSADPLGGFILDFCLKLSVNHKVSVITQRRAAVYEIEKKINLITFNWSGSNIPLSDLKLFKPNHIFHLFSLFRNAKKTIDDFCNNNSVDHVFALWAIPSGFASYYLLKKKNIPYDVWCLGSDIWKHKDNYLTKSYLIKILKNATNRYADGFEFCNDVADLAAMPCKFLPSSRIIEPTEFGNVNSDKKRFVFIGRYHYNKGPDVLMEAIKLLPDNISAQTEFVFYGTGTLKIQLIEAVSKHRFSNVFVHDIIDTENIYATLANAHFIIIPSRFDSIPVILSDALQCGIPMIGADIGDMGPLIKKYNLGFVFKKEDSQELAEKIEAAFHANKESYIQNIQQALLIFSVDNAVKQFTENLTAAK